ncbi:MAG: hypothetical protein KKC03_13400, partial [Bacteroidetes bacterium]|nr:hypothetical protein [Bacteroidota bacterium]
MSDRCYVAVDVLKKDAERLAHAIDNLEFLSNEAWEEALAEESAPSVEDAYACICEDNDAYLHLELEEVNYGAYDVFEEAGKAGLVFTAIQCHGDDYGPGAWASDGDGKPIFTPTDWEGYPYTRLDENGWTDDKE